MAEDEPRLPSEEELREALDQVGVADVLLNALSATASLGFHRVSSEGRDLGQARLAIEALRALEPVLREGGVEDGVVRDLEQARANLQLAYAKAVSEPDEEPTNPTEASEPTASDEQEPEPEG